ncbi:hypothetical protein F4808DRAFT_62575 [Astrocystis sublimbata]|nr:hypothetical protein F4808DRAFT_62575 [Astrocystis sublimbata]
MILLYEDNLRYERRSETNPAISLIESIPADLVAPLLSHCHSLDDLNAVIHASPILYHGFLAAKGTILLALLAADIGPGIRDALALAQIGQGSNLDRHSADYWVEAERAIQLYAGLPPVTLAARGISTELVVKMIQFNRTTQFFVNWFAYAKLLLFQQEVPTACYPITSHERHRISQALVRHQVLMNIHSAHDSASPRLETVRRDFFALFRAWELDQIYEINNFINKFAYGVPRRSTNTSVLSYLQDIALLRRVFVSKTQQDPDLEGRLRAGFRRDVTNNSQYYGSSLNWLQGSHLFPARAEVDPSAPPTFLTRHEIQRAIQEAKAIKEREELYVYEQELPALIAGYTASDPPYGWVDAMGGLSCCRWGVDLIQTRRPESSVEDRMNAKKKSWRGGACLELYFGTNSELV